MLRGAAVTLGAPMINRGRYALFAQGDIQYSVRAVDLVRRSTVIDMLGLVTLNYRKLSAWAAQTAEFSEADFVRLRASGITVFHPAVGFVVGDIHAQTLRDVRAWNSFIAAHSGQFQRIDSVTDFRQAKAEGKIGILIGQQNSAHFRTIDDIDSFYLMGQRVSQLTYRGTKIGGGSSDARDTGLSPYGIQIVERMNALGMAIDISHCGDRTTLNAIEASRKPVLVTHSNCRALVPGSLRCKTDEAIRRMAAKGGVMGFTMVRGFVRPSGRVTIEDVLDHVDHLVKVAGVEHAGIGSDVDLDGRDLFLKPEHRFDLDDIDYSRKIYDLTEGLLRRKYSNRNIELILGGNFERALNAAWTV